MKSYMIKRYSQLFCLCISLFSISSVSATSLLPISLEQLSTRASLIFYASVVNNQVRKDEISGRIATFTEFEIIELIKDDTGKDHSENRHIIKQLGGHLKSSQTIVRVHGVPKYQVGNRYVVFLPEESSLGFCSPLGLHQGSFAVTTINGEQIISNGHSLAQQSGNVFSNSSVQVPLAVTNNRPSQARLYDFINSVRAYNVP